MKKLQVAALSIAGAVAFAACAGAPSAPAANPQATAPTAAAAAPANAPTATQATALAASAPAAAGPARKVALTATNSLYSIPTFEAKAGEKIEFVLTNNGDEKHNLVAVGEGVSIVSPDFDAGQTVSFVWTAPTKAMTFKFICAFHKEVRPIAVTVR